MEYRSLKEWEEELEKTDSVIGNITGNVYILLGVSPGGRNVYVHPDFYETLVESPGPDIEKILKRYNLNDVDEALFNPRVPKEASSQILEAIEKNYTKTGLIREKQLKVPSIPKIVW